MTISATRSASKMRGDAERLADIITAFQRCFLVRLSKDLAKGNVSFPQYMLLGFLVQHDHLSMTEIANRMGHTTAAATGLVDRMEKLNLARRTHARDDRRKILVEPTPEGRALVASVRDEMVGNVLKILDALEPEEQRYWLRIYEKIYALCQNQ